MLEEAGMISDHWELYKTYQPIHKIDWEIYTFIARDCIKVAEQKLDVGEKIQIKECSFDEFIAIVLSPTYWGNELVMDVLRMKEAGTLGEWERKIFG
jgi:hypothetical protein